MASKDRVQKTKGATAIESREVIAKKIAISSGVIVEQKNNTKKKKQLPPKTAIDKIVSDTASRANDNLGMQELLPDLKLAKRILIPSILSPKDLTTTKLTVEINTEDLEFTPPATLGETIANHLRTRYPLEAKLYSILEETLFDYGSYVLAVIPETSLETLVKAGRLTGMESVEDFVNKNPKAFNKLGILSPKSPDLKYVSITDNINAVKMREVHRSAMQSTIAQRVGLENYLPSPLASLNVKGASARENNPLVLKLTSESVIPVHVPGDSSDHLGYYVVLDGNGRPVRKTKDSDQLNNLRKEIKRSTNNSAAGNLINLTGVKMGSGDAAKNPDLFIENYIDMIDGELHSQLKDGVYGDEVEVSRPNDVYRLMLQRVLQKKKSQLLYIPVEMASYFAFQYNSMGIGKSLLEDTKVFGSLRAVLMFAEVMAGIKNSVGHTRLNITLDEDDPDHQATVESVLQQFAALQSDKLPIQSLNSSDIVKALQRASIDVNIDGGEAFPGTKTDVEDLSRDIPAPDTTISETLRRYQYSGLGIPPEIVDNAMEGELATVVVSRNLLFAKQVMEMQDTFCVQLTKFVKMYTRASGELIEEIKTALREEKIEDSNENVNVIMDALRVTLPSPDLARVRNQIEAFDEYSDAIDKLVEIYVTEDMLGDILEGDVDARSLSSIRVSVAAMLKRDWVRRQNIFTDVIDAFDDEQSPIDGKIKAHNKAILKVVKNVMLSALREEDKITDRIDKLGEEEEEAAPGPDVTEPTPDDGGGDDPLNDPGF